MRPVPPVVSQLRIGANDYRITIQRMPRKTLSMHVSEGELIVKAPLGSNQQTIVNWVASKQSWIEKRIVLLNRLKLDDNEVWYLGRKVTVYPYDKTVISPDGIRLKRGASFDAAMRSQAIVTLTSFFNNAAYELGYGPKELKFRIMTRSWGRCSSKGLVTLNTRLIACDPRFIRYVCLHELIHLKYLDHSPAFWNEVKKHVPDLSAVKKLSIVINQQDRFEL